MYYGDSLYGEVKAENPVYREYAVTNIGTSCTFNDIALDLGAGNNSQINTSYLRVFADVSGFNRRAAAHND